VPVTEPVSMAPWLAQQAPLSLDLLDRGGRSFSFDRSCPPKTDADDPAVARDQAACLWRPTFVSVTLSVRAARQGPHRAVTAGSLAETTLTRRRSALSTAFQSLRLPISGIVVSYSAVCVQTVLALRATPRSAAEWVAHPRAQAASCCPAVREAGDFCVALAPSPQGTPRRQQSQSDVPFLHQKLHAARISAVTQMFFYSGRLTLRFRDEGEARSLLR